MIHPVNQNYLARVQILQGYIDITTYQLTVDWASPAVLTLPMMGVRILS
jgi:hypothetical protein